MKQVSREAAGVIEFRQDIQGTAALEVPRGDPDDAGGGAHRGAGVRPIRAQRTASRATATAAQGLQELDIPRGRIVGQDGNTREFRSAILPRYARRARQVDEAILGAYLAGANTRRIRKALSPLLGKAHLSKSTISRVVGRLKAYFERWRQRDLSGERYSTCIWKGSI